MDGIDASVLHTDGEGVVKAGASISIPSSQELKDLLWRALKVAARLTDRSARPGPLLEAEEAVTAAHAEAVAALLAKSGMGPRDVDVIGFHGQTVLHRPDQALTVQLGNASALAAMTGIDVVADFRANDMASGGEGAPLAPIYHQALSRNMVEMPVAFLNLGGVANVTLIDRDAPPLAFDTGPANGLIDQWMLERRGDSMDRGGETAAAGQTDEAVLAALLANPYFDRAPPKSLDRFEFSLSALGDLNDCDGAATLTAFTAASVALSALHLTPPPNLWVVCGGGRHNPTLMAELANRLSAPVVSAEQVGLRGDSIEAEAFAYMAVRSLKNLPLTFPSTTGVAEPLSGGVLFYAA